MRNFNFDTSIQKGIFLTILIVILAIAAHVVVYSLLVACLLYLSDLLINTALFSWNNILFGALAILIIQILFGTKIKVNVK